MPLTLCKALFHDPFCRSVQCTSTWRRIIGWKLCSPRISWRCPSKQDLYSILWDFLAAWRKKKTKTVVPKWILPPCPKKFSNFPQLHLFVFVGLAKPLWSLAPVEPLTMAYKYRCLVLNCKTLLRSLRQLNETRRRIKKFNNYLSQSAAHPFSLKFFFKNLVR